MYIHIYTCIIIYTEVIKIHFIFRYYKIIVISEWNQGTDI